VKLLRICVAFTSLSSHTAGRKPQTTEKEDLSEAERLMLRDEFLETMKLRFINGEDRDFNYRFDFFILTT